MFQLLQPIWLFALAGLSIPVIIHLWNRKPGKILKVGSIALVKESLLPYKRKIKLAELLLLLLRCLLLACIAVALTSPVWRSAQLNNSKGWVLMGRQQLAATYNRFKPKIDSLLQAGMEFHYFEEGFKQDKIENALHLQPDSSQSKKIAYRNIIAALNEQADSKLPLYVFTDNYLRNFNGKRNAVSLNLHWFTYAADTSNAGYPSDTSIFRITIFSRTNTSDARYLSAAIDAIQQFSKRNIIVKTVTDSLTIPAQQDWLFWLDDATPGNVKNAKNVLEYTKGEPVKRNSYILPAGTNSFAAIDLYKSVIEKDSAKKMFDACWRDGFGGPLLTVQQKNNAAYYYLYTHLDPRWNELPWNDNFPAILYKLLYTRYNEKETAGTADKRLIDPSQAMPVLISSAEAGIKPAIFTETKLSNLFWVIAFILFFAERCLSFYYRKMSMHE